jgi:hypothetical protein
MISRMTLVGALVVVELGIVGMAAKAVGDPGPSGPFGFQPPTALGPWTKGQTTSSDVDKSFFTGPVAHVHVDVAGVHVIVQAASTNSVHVVGRTHRGGWVTGDFPPISAVQTPDGVRITARADDGPHVTFGMLTREVQITVPAAALVEVVGAERIDASGLRAKFVAHIVEGPIYVKDHRGDLDLSCSGGRIVLVDVQGADIAANTRDGRLLFTRVGADRIDATTGSGRIAAVDLRAVDGALITHDGRVSVSFTSNTDATVNVHTGDGHVNVAGLPATESEDRRSVVHVGTGRGHFEVSSGDGSITITQGASV